MKRFHAINSVTAGEKHVAVTGPNTESGMDDLKNKLGHDLVTMAIEKCAV